MVNIRHFERADFNSVEAIYQQGIEGGNATFQKKTKSWDEWNRSMLAFCRLVIAENDRVVGWAALSPISTRAVYSGVAEVSIYISEISQGKGFGRKLLARLIEDSEANNIWTLQAGIFPENTGSITLHQKNGFKILGVREKLGQMNGVWRDVVLMERRSQLVGQ